MAILPASSTSLATFETVIRASAGALSPQESLVFNDELDEMIDRAVNQTYSIARLFLHESYITVEPVTEVSGTIDLSGKRIAEKKPNKMKLTDSISGEINIVTPYLWQSIKTLYPAGELDNAIFARLVTQVIGTNEVYSFQVFRGTNRTTVGTQEFTYCRLPKRAVLPAEMIDLPDDYIAISEDIGTLMLMRRIAHAPPAELEQRVVAFIQSQAQQAQAGGKT